MASPHVCTGAALWCKRFGWLLLIWASSVTAISVAAWGLKGVMRWVGLAP
jgi:hypothetical protein